MEQKIFSPPTQINMLFVPLKKDNCGELAKSFAKKNVKVG